MGSNVPSCHLATAYPPFLDCSHPHHHEHRIPPMLARHPTHGIRYRQHRSLCLVCRLDVHHQTSFLEANADGDMEFQSYGSNSWLSHNNPDYFLSNSKKKQRPIPSTTRTHVGIYYRPVDICFHHCFWILWHHRQNPSIYSS